MNKVGIIGITSEGASICYKTVVSESSKILGGFNNVEVALVQPNFNRILEAQKSKDWDKVAEIIVDSGKELEKLGVTNIIIPANSIHFAIKQIQKQLTTKVVNLLEVVKEVCLRKNYKRALVLGVGITMSDHLYKEVLEKNGIEYMIPSEKEREFLDEIIYTELVKGVINGDSTKQILETIQNGKENSCDVVILACTELPMVINDTNSPLPIIDTTRELAIAALTEAHHTTL
ncbi:MAG TPA: amino acid racemase [Candidatus Dojkabacteria bacterium]|nr:amino acid racemase [Candidatus Dojkabacteria bacterium]